MKQPILYQYAVCPFCCKVEAILNYKKIPYKAVEVHPLNKKEIAFSKDYKKVPIYIDEDGNQINDSTPIMRHIDRRHPEKKVFETDPVAKQKEEEWLQWSDDVLVKALPPLIYQNFGDAVKAFDYITRVGKFNWFQKMMIKYSGAFAMTMVARKSAKRQNIDNPEQHLRNCLRKWGEAISNGEFLNGTCPNGADLAIYGILKSIENLPGFRIMKEDNDVHPWYQRVANIIEGMVDFNDMNIVEEVKETLQSALPEAEIYILDPLQDGAHLEALVISPQFEGNGLVKQHQMVMHPLNDHFHGDLHALSVKTFTPKQWETEKVKYKV